LSAGVLAVTEVAGGCDSTGAGVSSDFLISGVAGEVTLAITLALTAGGSLVAGAVGGAEIEGESESGTGAGDFGGDAAALVPLVVGGALGE
jgi:hypothetical protein